MEGTPTTRGLKRGRKKLPTPVKKERKREREKQRTLISLGSQSTRWTELKNELKLTHERLAKILLDRYYAQRTSTSMPTSTPTASSKPLPPIQLSDIESKSESDAPMSGVESAGSGPEAAARESKVSMFDPNDMSVNLTYEEIEDEYNEDNDDDTYPNYKADISFQHNNIEEVMKLPTVTGDDDILPGDEEVEIGPIPDGSKLFSKVTSAEEIVGQSCFLTYESSIRLLLEELLPPCPCSKKYVVSFQKSGTGTYVKWSCPDGHGGGQWCSQPKLNLGMLAGDFFWSTSLLFSGNNYRKVRFMSQWMNSGFVSEKTYYAIQRDYGIPAVEHHFRQMQDEILASCQNKEVIIAGDGRMDSPGHSAQYCTYVVTNYETGDVLDIQVVEKKETQLNSNAMEKEGLLRSLRFLRERGINVVEIVTDAHVSIAAHIRKNEPGMKHSWDVWHGTKNLAKKIIAAGQKKATRDIIPWSKDLCTHFWECARTCEGSHGKFLSKWRGAMHHVQNEHEWLSGDGFGTAKCEHNPLPPDEERMKKWLEPSSQGLAALGQILLNKRFQKDIGHYVNNRHTGHIESINSHILMYCSKRNSYKPPGYRARNYLAVMDYQNHKDRGAAVDLESGEIRYTKCYSKHAKSWIVKPQAIRKTYDYIHILQTLAFDMRMTSARPLAARVLLEPWDPRNLGPNTAPVPAPPKDVLVRDRKSRFK
ncbi:uncharacterized protein LOC106154126 [Lingula anatina]|uniref:Uncharacterized protein LOC106154126 n=1 Tax=Lingula anatina TaxID=7574 RepID=A0A1S3HEA1_LINAN|nr:uncharacterized protein LOC106154126 [Lingula anatina]|eukprot:XP_013383831.1 uncharacterized protein LOC106154126 [Lingula anatina]